MLVVDDDPAFCEALGTALERRAYRVEHRTSGADALAAMAETDPAVVLTDINMARMDGLALCRRLSEDAPDVPVILITAFGSLETAVGGIRAGAWDFVTKPIEIESLVPVLDRAIEVHGLRRELRRLRAANLGDAGPELLGRSPAMDRLRSLIGRVAPTDVTVLVTGESGSGKEVVARSIHAASGRRAGPFVAVNCAAMPESLLESELFGHVRGAFTDARTPRAGLVFQATGGTLFLDEIGELPLALQPKLLRALQERRARPVGGANEQPFDARILVATNRDLAAEVEAGRFRQDLYFRLDVVEVPVPPLRARDADVLLLAQRFVEAASRRFGKAVQGVSAGAAERLLAYDWPGNVRELANAVERGVALTSFNELTPDDLPARVREAQARPVLRIDDPSELVTLAELEARYIRRVLATVGGNKAAAARILGVDRTTLYRRLGSD